MTPTDPTQPSSHPNRWPGALVWALAALAMAVLHPVLDLANLAMLLVLASALAALWLTPAMCLAACALAVLAFNFAFVPPRFTFSVDLHQHALLLATMLSVSWIVALLMARQRRLAEAERLLAQRARQLQDFGELLRDADDPLSRAADLQSAVLLRLGDREGGCHAARRFQRLGELGADLFGVLAGEVLQVLQRVFLCLLADTGRHQMLGGTGQINAVADQDSRGYQQA